MTLMQTFRGLTVASLFALVVLVLYAGDPGELSWWAGGSMFAVWIIAPAAAPYLLAARWPRRWFVIVMALFFVVSSSFSGMVYHDAFFRSRSSTAAIVLVLVPVYQWLGLALLLLMCCGVAVWLRWRSRPG